MMIYKTNALPTELVPLGAVIRNFQTEKMRIQKTDILNIKKQ